MSYEDIRTEHAGAKNGGGYWGPRADAKLYSRVKRRQEGKRQERTAEGSVGRVVRQRPAKP